MQDVAHEGARGDEVAARFVSPEVEEDAPAIVVCCDEEGFDEAVQAACDRFVSRGFHALVPDLSPRESDRDVLADLDGAVRWLARRDDVDADRIAVLGLGRGGTLAFLFACHSRELVAAVTFGASLTYPQLSAQRPMQPIEMALNLSCPWLAFFGEADDSVDADERGQMDRVLSQFARDFDIVSLPGAGRGFYRTEAATGAWERTSSFLAEHFDF